MSVDNSPSADVPTTTTPSDADTSADASDTGPVPANASAATHHTAGDGPAHSDDDAPHVVANGSAATHPTVDPTPSDDGDATADTGNAAHDAYMADLAASVSNDD